MGIIVGIYYVYFRYLYNIYRKPPTYSHDEVADATIVSPQAAFGALD